jgi:hypothetical protein
MKQLLLATLSCIPVGFAPGQSSAQENAVQFTQSARRVLDELKAQEGIESSRCMIPPVVVADTVVFSRDPRFVPGDRILEVAGEPLDPSMKTPVRHALLKHPPDATLSLKITRMGVEQTLSVSCSDQRPFFLFYERALVNATQQKFADCAAQLEEAQKLHPLTFPFAAVLFECRQRSGTLQTSIAQGTFDIAQQMIRESAYSPALRDKVHPIILKQAERLAGMGALPLSMDLKKELDGAVQGSDLAAPGAPEGTLQTAAVSPSGGGFVFKGLEVGAITSPAQVEAALHSDSKFSNISQVKCGAGLSGAHVCNGWTSAGGVPANCNALIAGTGHLMRISLTIFPDSFDTVVQGAIQKYGKPTRSASNTVQNRMGATFQNQTLIWGNEQGFYIRIDKYGSTLDRGLLYFGSAEDTALLKQSTAPKSGDF